MSRKTVAVVARTSIDTAKNTLHLIGLGDNGLARIERLVFGAWNPEMGAVGTLWDVVRDRRLNHRPEVVAGVLADECSASLQDFFATKRDSG